MSPPTSRAGPRQAVGAAAIHVLSTSAPTELQVQRWCGLVDAAAAELAAAPVWRHLQHCLGQLPQHCAAGRLRHLVVYGLGSLEQPGAVHIRFQLAAATLLAAALRPHLASTPLAFDPVFTPLDVAVLARCGFEVRGVQR